MRNAQCAISTIIILLHTGQNSDFYWRRKRALFANEFFQSKETTSKQVFPKHLLKLAKDLGREKNAH